LSYVDEDGRLRNNRKMATHERENYMNTEELITWHALKPEPELFDKDNSEVQVTGVWSAVFLPEGTDDYFADGPFIVVDSYVEVMPGQEDDHEMEYGITTQLEFGIREDGDVNTSYYLYEYGVLAEWDVAEAFKTCKGIVKGYIETCNRDFSWDGKSEVKG
jgi:hypothetical protein